MLRKALLLCGILSSLLYAAMTIFVARLWPEYDSASRTISELSAIGAPTRSIWAIPGAIYTVLIVAFGWGVWESAGRVRVLRIVAGLILGEPPTIDISLFSAERFQRQQAIGNGQ